MSNATKIEFSASDTVGVIFGKSPSGKSTLCNCLRTTIDFPRDGREVADVCTSEPRVYNLKNSKHDKILDVRSEKFPDEDMASFAARNHLHRADYVILIRSHRDCPPDDEEIIEWCSDNNKPILFICADHHEYILMTMQAEEMSQSEARAYLRKDKQLAVRLWETPCFAVDTKQWQTAIEAYQAGDYDAAQLHYDEGELLKFVARVGQAKSTVSGGVSAYFKSHAKRESQNESENYPETTQLETALLNVHFISRTRLDGPIPADCSVVSVQTQT